MICEGFLLFAVFKTVLGVCFSAFYRQQIVVLETCSILSLFSVLLNFGVVPYSLSLSEFYLCVSFRSVPSLHVRFDYRQRR